LNTQKHGTIVNLSSIGGRITFPYFSLYHATKFAVEGLTESLQYELNPLGIRLKLVEPGAFKTDFGSRSLQVFDAGKYPDYQEQLESFFGNVGQMMENSGDPKEVADTIFAASTDSTEQLRYLVGNDAVHFSSVRKGMEDSDFKRLVKEQMGL